MMGVQGARRRHVGSVLTEYAANCLRYKRFGIALIQLSRTVKDHSLQAYNKRAEGRANRC